MARSIRNDRDGGGFDKEMGRATSGMVCRSERVTDLVLLIFNIAVKSEKLVVKGYIEFNFSFQSLSLSLFLPKYQLTKIDRLRIYIFIYFKKDSSGYIERFTEL